MAWRGPPQFGTLARGRFCPSNEAPFLSAQRWPRPANERKREPRLGHIPTRPRPDRIARGQLSLFGEAHLRRILKSYADYYNSVRTHRSLHKDAPISRPIHQTGIIRSQPILGGLYHHYVRV